MLGVLLGQAALPAAAQQSASFRLEESAFNQGGSPTEGLELQSPSYRVSLSSLGESLVQPTLTGTGFSLDGGIVGSVKPAGEVLGLRFDDSVTLAWDPEGSVGTYTLYRDALTTLGATASCLQEDLTAPDFIDGDSPASGTGFLYLVSATNRLDEEGPLGFGSAGAARSGSPVCP